MFRQFTALVALPGVALMVGSTLAGQARVDARRPERPSVSTLGLATMGTPGLLGLRMEGAPQVGAPFQLRVERALPLSTGFLLQSLEADPVVRPDLGATIFPGEPLVVKSFGVDARGDSSPLLALDRVGPHLVGRSFVAQAVVLDPGAMGGLSVSRALAVRFGGGARPPLFPATRYPIDQAFGTIAIADLNADGAPDIVEGAEGEIVLLFGNGRGTFGSPVRSGAGSAGFVALDDLNGDGFVDIVAAADSAVLVQLGLGDGTFGAPVTYDPGGQPVQVPVLEDMDADGALDVVLALTVPLPAGAAVSVLRGQGDGTFSPAELTTFGHPQSTQRPAALSVGDLNGDAVPDVALTRSSGSSASDSLWVLLGVGDGTFGTPAVYFTVSQVTTPTPVEIADVNGDDKADLVVGSALHLGTGDGTFAGFQPLPTHPSSRVQRIVDMTGDGILDLIALNFVGNSNLDLLVGHGDGTFDPPCSLTTFGGNGRPLLVDLNADGHLDMALGGRSGVSIWLGTADGSFLQADGFRWGSSFTPWKMRLADIDGDQESDVLVSVRFEDLGLMRGRGDGTFDPPIAIPLQGGAEEVLVGDLDGDRVPDLVLSDGVRLKVKLGIGGGSFEPQVDYPATAPELLVAGDFDRDGDLDVAAVTAGGELSLFRGAGDGSLVLPAETVDAGGVVSAMTVGDWNLDGVPDLALANKPTILGESEVSLVLTGEDGTFFPWAFLPLSARTDSFPNAVTSGDLDRDGIADLVASYFLSGDERGWLGVFRGRHDGTFDSVVRYPVGIRQPGDVLIEDFDGDLRPDVAVGCRRQGDVVLLLGNGDGTLRAAIAYPTSIGRETEYNRIAAGDLNGDQLPELVATGFSSGALDSFLTVLPNLLFR